MKENKVAIQWLIVILTISFAFVIVLEWQLDKFTIGIMQGHRTFVINALLGIFSSSVLALIISIISYKVKRKKLLYEYYKVTQSYLHETTFFYKQYLDNVSNEEIISGLQRKEPKYEIKDLQIFYLQIAFIKPELAFFVKKNKYKEQINSIYNTIGKIHSKYLKLLKVAYNLEAEKMLCEIHEQSKQEDEVIILKEQCNDFGDMLKIHIKFE